MNISLDVMGGDYAPDKAIEGAIEFINNHEFDGSISLIGEQSRISALLKEYSFDKNKIKIIHADQVIEMTDHPTKALKSKPNSSISIGFKQLAENNTDAFISAGSTGAMLVGALYSIKNIPGVVRPAIGAYIPQLDGSLSLLIDVGLNSDCKSPNLAQYAKLGSIFSQTILGLDSPKVALLNVGEEETKGNNLYQTAHQLLKEQKNIHFIGNIESRYILSNKADVFVCDGFTGNIILKFAEAFYMLSRERDIHDDYIDSLNFEKYGGVPILGVQKPVIIGHGISGKDAFANMIHTAERMIKNDFINKVKDAFN